mmetsp:Transcript_8369/g.26003  ORF Transcript_8369/g.26003 Transcript_8369/m.26003 type:complete len:240 (+) Transcript_8369:2312-3031(+)
MHDLGRVRQEREEADVDRRDRPRHRGEERPRHAGERGPGEHGVHRGVDQAALEEPSEHGLPARDVYHRRQEEDDHARHEVHRERRRRRPPVRRRHHLRPRRRRLLHHHRLVVLLLRSRHRRLAVVVVERRQKRLGGARRLDEVDAVPHAAVAQIQVAAHPLKPRHRLGPPPDLPRQHRRRPEPRSMHHLLARRVLQRQERPRRLVAPLREVQRRPLRRDECRHAPRPPDILGLHRPRYA